MSGQREGAGSCPGATETRHEKDAGQPRRLLAAELLGGDREVVIVHRGQDYRLRITSNDKLILTK